MADRILRYEFLWKRFSLNWQIHVSFHSRFKAQFYCTHIIEAVYWCPPPPPLQVVIGTVWCRKCSQNTVSSLLIILLTTIEEEQIIDTWCERSHQGETKCIATTNKILIHGLWHVSLCVLEEVWGKMKLNESGRQKLGSPLSRRSMQSLYYILT